MEQVATYQKSIADLQQAAEKQRGEFQAVIDKQTTQIAQLNSQVDTLTNVRTALVDTVGQLRQECKHLRFSGDFRRAHALRPFARRKGDQYQRGD